MGQIFYKKNPKKNPKKNRDHMQRNHFLCLDLCLFQVFKVMGLENWYRAKVRKASGVGIVVMFMVQI